MADVGPPKAAPPDGGLAAFQRRLCCIIYRQEITDKRPTRRGLYPCSGESGTTALLLPGFITLGHAHLPGQGVGPILVWGCPKAEPEMVPLCALLWSCALPCTETPGATALPEQGQPRSSIWGLSPQEHVDFPARGKGSRHGGAQGREGLVPRARGQHLALDLSKVCLIPDKEATPGTWLANRRSLGNSSEGSAGPRPPAPVPGPSAQGCC